MRFPPGRAPLRRRLLNSGTAPRRNRRRRAAPSTGARTGRPLTNAGSRRSASSRREPSSAAAQAAAWKRRGGSSSGSSVRSKVPKCMPTDVRARRSSAARTASSGFICNERHDRARFVGADRQRREVDRSEARADLGEAVEVAGVAGVEEAARRPFHDPARPQAALVVGRVRGRRSAGPERSGRARGRRSACCHQSSSSASPPASRTSRPGRAGR